ncbi:class I SAM-dependent methyltransferase [Flagellimonas zhangzhouensis]|uniref:Nodulation protein S (NodS) n=1 Tax=Flagellimonas zhangzhouensis TaxID=1073328 RepID=A0A1H2UKY5_9FLAO|nr:class I SAM-dependent methyltransferase [Allomuricauda zhangzhouensis]SDQ16072.1 Methyltransferase domain-containing protein [Allomuricauda zhangzhouensis]SDW56792.1 Nodulation protein S (NodS) [Allomuricauda zhangzhouensis]
MDRKEHWETVYNTKNPDEVSWTQEKPQTSLDFIHSFNLEKRANIIDIGGGDSTLVDFLLEEGFENITVLDISAKALERAQSRLGEKAKKVNWVVSDITQFEPTEQYELWHDRAAFHFLTEPEQISNYVKLTEKAVKGFLVLGTFSEQGPKKCSGLDITRYSEEKMGTNFQKTFQKLECKTVDHTTPFGTTQNFIFCSFRKKD